MSDKKSLAIAYAIKRRNAKKGMDKAPMPKMDHEEHYEGIADAILAKKMADGGMVDERDESLIDNETEGFNLEDDLSFDLLHDDHGIVDEKGILEDIKKKKRK